MEKETRGSLEKLLDEALGLEAPSSDKDTNLLFEEIVFSSKRDLVLGYEIGLLVGVCSSVLRVLEKNVTNDDSKEVMNMVKRRVPEVASKIEMDLNK